MTTGLENLISDLGPSTIFRIATYTSYNGPASINNQEDADESAEIVINDLEPSLNDYDAYLVACYSVHPLVSLIRERADTRVSVMGIFEASVIAALALLPQRKDMQHLSGGGYETFGIVSTGKYWEEALSRGVKEFLGTERECLRFKGVETTGLSAGELHTADPGQVRGRIKDATKRLVRGGDCSVVCLGCAGMAGMDDTVREAIVEELGEQAARRVRIVDGVKAGVGILEGLERMFPGERA